MARSAVLPSIIRRPAVLPSIIRRPAVLPLIIRRSLALFLLASLALTAAPAAAAPAPPGDALIADAADFLRSQQLDDGGFDVSGFAYFETPDVILALAEAAQTSTTWSTAEALAAVEATLSPSGRSPLGALDDLVDTAAEAGQAAKLVVTVTGPLGLDAAAFDPDGDGATDLVQTLRDGAAADGSYGFFNSTLYALLAHAVLGEPIPANTVDLVLGAQQGDGSWNYLGDDDPAVAGDVDTTALALQALMAAGVAPDDPAVDLGVGSLARAVGSDGAFPGFSTVNASAVAVLALTAVGASPDNPCWRDFTATGEAGTAYASSDGYLRSEAQADGSINDGSPDTGVFATAQATQALARRWLPIGRAAPRCASSAELVRAAYADLLGRDVAGSGYWAGLLDSGVGRLAVGRALLGSHEHLAVKVGRFYTAYLDRPADSGGAAYFRARLAAGMPSLAVVVALVSSGEYLATHGGTNQGVVDGFYADLLGRPADTGGRAYFTAQLDAGSSRAAVAASILTSAEGRAFLVRQLYDDEAALSPDPYPGLLDRPADPLGLAVFGSALAAGATPESIIARLVASEEYDRLALG